MKTRTREMAKKRNNLPAGFFRFFSLDFFLVNGKTVLNQERSKIRTAKMVSLFILPTLKFSKSARKELIN